MVGRPFSHYRVLGRIGEGGMGVVYRAHDDHLDRDVALKVLPHEATGDATARARLLREARLASRFNHPHICTIFEVGEADGQAYIAMELVEGRTLGAELASGALPADQVLRYGMQLADALGHAHDRGVVHRDFKSANVMLTPDGRVKVLDFGLAGRVPDGDQIDSTTMNRTLNDASLVAGTLPYMAPEQLRGLPADPRSDVWALGVVLYEMAGAQRPFLGNTGFELSSAILSGEAPPLPAGVPAPLGTVIGRCLAKTPEARYQRGSEVRAALEAVQSGTAGPASPGTRLPRRGWMRSVVAGAGALIVLAALVFGLNLGGVRGRGGTIGTAAPAKAIRLAVLPFVNPSRNPAQEYLAEGLTIELTARLGRLHPGGLEVIGRSSVLLYKNSGKSIEQVGRELGVEYVLEGTAQQEAGRVHVTAGLVKVSDQSQLWADSYELEMAGMLSLQRDVARSVAGALALALLPAEQARLAKAPPVNPEAYEAYLKGTQQWIQLTQAGLDNGQQYFELALRKSPDYAPAYAGLALVWASRQQVGFVPPQEAGPKAKAAAQKAVELDDTLADAHVALADVLTWTDWDWPAAEREWKRAIDLNPNSPDAHAYYSHYLNFIGRPDEAMTHIDLARRIDPLNVIFQSFYATDLLYARKYDEAISEGRRILRANPNNAVALTAIWWATLCQKKPADALAAAKAYVTTLYDMPGLGAAIDNGFASAGYTEAMARGAAMLSERARTSFVVPFDVAGFYAAAGNRPAALDWLEKGFEQRDPSMPYLGLPMFEGLRSEPRFRALADRLHLTLR